MLQISAQISAYGCTIQYVTGVGQRSEQTVSAGVLRAGWMIFCIQGALTSLEMRLNYPQHDAMVIPHPQEKQTLTLIHLLVHEELDHCKRTQKMIS